MVYHTYSPNNRHGKNRSLITGIILGGLVFLFVLSLLLKDFYYQYSPGELTQFPNHFQNRTVQVQGAVLRSMIPALSAHTPIHYFIIIDELKTPLAVQYKGSIEPLLKAGEKVLLVGTMKKSIFKAETLQRL